VRNLRSVIVSCLAAVVAAAATAQVPAAAPAPNAPPAAAVAPPPAPPGAPAVRAPEAAAGLQIKYVRDSAEYAALMEQTYRVAASAVERARRALPTGSVWAVVLDVDETTLDNSTYELERAAYGVPYEPGSWHAWVERAQAPAVPGVAAFVRGVRALGGRVAYVTNRAESDRAATRRNLEREGLWQSGDLLCPKPIGSDPTKAGRRAEVRTGRGDCAWPGSPAAVLAYLGDQMVDFPAAGEEADLTGPEAFGVRCFLLPNPMYGDWTSRVTRPR